MACPQCGEYAGIEERACAHCGQALGDFRQGPAYHLELAGRYLQSHMPDRAQEALDRAESEAAGDADVLVQVGALYEQAGLRSRAIGSYERAIEAAPRDPALYARLGTLYRQHGERALHDVPRGARLTVTAHHRRRSSSGGPPTRVRSESIGVVPSSGAIAGLVPGESAR